MRTHPIVFAAVVLGLLVGAAVRLHVEAAYEREREAFMAECLAHHFHWECSELWQTGEPRRALVHTHGGR